MAEDLTLLSTDVLRGKLKAALAVQRTVLAIFGVIVLAWIVLGFWRTNTPVFISTIAMGVFAVVATSATPRTLSTELRRRESAA